MRTNSYIIWSMALIVAFTFTSCEILNQLSAAKDLQSGNASVIKGDNTLPGAQKGGYAIKNTPYNVTANPNGVRYKDHIFQNVKKTHETYATGAKQFNGQAKNLMMDIYEPANDNTKNRPCVVFVYGGGWFMKTLDGMSQFGKGFAMKGYVSVSIDYRIGFQNGTGMAACKSNYNGFEAATYRAAQDAKAAIRYLKANATRLGIDKNKIFIGGHSAGGFTTINAVHLDDSDVPQALKTKEGNLNSIGKYQNETTTVAGEYILSGGAISSLNYVDKNVPTLILQGTCDEFLKNGAGNIYKCNTNPMVYTGQALNDKLKRNGACVEFSVLCGGDHSYTGYRPEKQVALVSDFIYRTMKGNCKTRKKGVQGATTKCQAADNTVCN